ncbi:flagellar protein FlaG [Chitinimonas arctica]|uniref:Flagellar protein FlaG n=1 Tax=Chitinimonas arctica TaxID=2594795 RepID=A0A516SL81_9NEIS|nr:flagellar protein FlaG [Chitinimonas arctica]QDQ28914.1 flagellar protein FlaG [Chitinimonas arctica]
MPVQALNNSLVAPSTSQIDPNLARSLLQSEPAAKAVDGGQQLAATAKTTQTEQKQPSVEDSVRKLNQAISASGRSIQFSIDDDTKLKIVKVVDLESKAVIRQIPTEDVVEIARAIDKLQGLLIRDKA